MNNPGQLFTDALAGQIDPFKLKELLWPWVTFYKKQKQIIYSVWYDDETVVPAANEMGKDFAGGFIGPAFFLTRHPCRVVTTSATDDHLRVLWGEMGKFINTSKYPLNAKEGGPLLVNHQDVRKIVDGKKCDISYIIGMVASPDRLAAMQGHHVADVGDGIARNLFMADESSSVPDGYFKMADTWARRKYIFGNTWDCNNYFRRAVEGVPGTDDRGGNIPRDGEPGYYRRVIHIKAQDSPNVQLAEAEIRAGLPPSGRTLVPGVKSWRKYKRDRRLLDPIRAAVSLDAVFYAGAEVRLFPSAWLDRANALHRDLSPSRLRRARAVGIDPGEGGDKTAMAAVDEYGLIELVSKKTPDTSVIQGEAVAFIRRHGCDPECVMIDRGGGGKQIADNLRSKGYDVRTVGFGETIALDPRLGMTPLDDKREQREERYAYVNRRAQMYGELRELLDPNAADWKTVVEGDTDPDDDTPEQYASLAWKALRILSDKPLEQGQGFAIPGIGPVYGELRRQLTPIPLLYDEEGRLKLPPKRKKNDKDKTLTLVDLIGCSPDEADALVLAVHGMIHEATAMTAGAV